MNRRILILLIFFLAAGVFVYRNWFSPLAAHANHPSIELGFDRNETRIILTKHATCRMNCRHISEDDIRSVLKEGTINYNKSDLNSKPDPKYALEGKPREHHLRVIFAPTSRGMVVITCIDLDEDYPCDCS